MIGDRLRLDWLWDRIVDLPRGDRWVGLARNALREDVEAEHRAVVDAVLRTAGTTLDADVTLDAWVATQPAAVERTLALVDDIAAHGVFDLATLSVALRELRALT